MPGWWSADWVFVPLPDQPPGIYFIFNRYRGGGALTVARPPFSFVTLDRISSAETDALWFVEKVGDFHRIRSAKRRDMYLHIENGRLEVGPIQPGWLSAQWQLRNFDNTPDPEGRKMRRLPSRIFNDWNKIGAPQHLLFVRFESAVKPGYFINYSKNYVDMAGGDLGNGLSNWILQYSGSETTGFRIINNRRQTGYLSINNGLPSVLPDDQNDDAGNLKNYWKIESSGADTFRIRNVLKPDHYLNLFGGPNYSAQLDITKVDPASPGAQWRIRPYDPNPLNPALLFDQPR